MENLYKKIITPSWYIEIFYDLYPENPLKMTDAPVTLVIDGEIEHDGNLPKDKKWEKLYFNLGDYGFSLTTKSRANGYLATEAETWKAYAGCPLTSETLPGIAADLECYYNKDCYYYAAYRRVLLDGVWYREEKPSGTDGTFYSGYYGVDSLKEELKNILTSDEIRESF